nr:MAG TPA: hypothetical protein [Bacteriophage sp.]
MALVLFYIIKAHIFRLLLIILLPFIMVKVLLVHKFNYPMVV